MNFREGFRRIGLVLGVLGFCAGTVVAYFIVAPLWPVWREHNKFQRLLNVATVKRVSGSQWLTDHAAREKSASPCDTASGTISQPFGPPPPTSHEGLAHVPPGSKLDAGASTGGLHVVSSQPLPDQSGNPQKDDLWKIVSDSCWRKSESGNGREEWTNQHEFGTAHVEGDWWTDAFAPDPNPDGIKTIRYWEYAPGQVRALELTNGDWSSEPPSPPELREILIPLFYPLIGFLLPWGATKVVIWIVTGFAASKAT